MQFDHKIIPVKNIDLIFNLAEAKNYLSVENKTKPLDQVFFSGLHDKFNNEKLKINGRIDLLGVCFLPFGLYPFIKIPMSEFKNQIIGADEISFKLAGKIRERLMETVNTPARLGILEHELEEFIKTDFYVRDNFPFLFNNLEKLNKEIEFADICIYNVSMRTMERMYNKYVGIPAKTYNVLSRFQRCANQLLYLNNSKLSDIAYINDYFDQMHFIKDFKRFTGNTPKMFLQNDDSLKHIGKPL